MPPPDRLTVDAGSTNIAPVAKGDAAIITWSVPEVRNDVKYALVVEIINMISRSYERHREGVRLLDTRPTSFSYRDDIIVRRRRYSASSRRIVNNTKHGEGGDEM